MKRLLKISMAAFVAAGLAAGVSADDSKPRFESSGFLQSLDAFIAEQMAKQATAEPVAKAGAIPELKLSNLETPSGSNHSFFKLSDSRTLPQSSLQGLSDKPDFSSLMAPTGEMRGGIGRGLYDATSRMAITFGGKETSNQSKGLELALQTGYRLSVDGMPASVPFADLDVASHEYNFGIEARYSGFGLDASLMRYNSYFENDMNGFDVGLSYQATSWSARLSLTEYKEGADLYGIENEARNIVSVELGASYRFSNYLGLSGGVRYYDYGDRWIVSSLTGDNSRMVFLGGKLQF
ncbi:hypothetical protein [Kordiimonas pumila]|uniref:Outer membrane protein beta-barrel domain-containing protein n=2 Tax=Kordiimonas pumila TaxID=2161677 RepID=A0ABV7D8V7_9PROT